MVYDNRNQPRREFQFQFDPENKRGGSSFGKVEELGYVRICGPYNPTEKTWPVKTLKGFRAGEMVSDVLESSLQRINPTEVGECKTLWTAIAPKEPVYQARREDTPRDPAVFLKDNTFGSTVRVTHRESSDGGISIRISRNDKESEQTSLPRVWLRRVDSRTVQATDRNKVKIPGTVHSYDVYELTIGDGEDVKTAPQANEVVSDGQKSAE